MSIGRHLFNEFRPFLRMLDEPLGRASVGFNRPQRSSFDDPFSALNRAMLRGPAVDVSEAGNSYVVEAELPGVKKENLEVRIGDGGRSLTIEGKLLSAKEGSENNAPDAENSTQISTERSVFGSFTRTVFLPRPVESRNVVAKLEDGILKLTLNKMEDKASVAVTVE